MLQQLRQKTLKAKMPLIFILAAGLLVVGYFAVPSLLLLLRGPVDLYSLDISEIEGRYVTAQVDTLLGAYAETTSQKEGQRPKTTYREYVMPVQGGLIGLEVPAILLSDAESVLDDTERYLLDETGDYVWDGSYVEVAGTVQPMDEETRAFYEETLRDYFGFTDEEIAEFCYPLVLCHGAVGNLEPGLHNLLYIGFGLLLLALAWILVAAMTGRYQKQIKAYCAARPDPEGTLHELDLFYENIPTEDGIKLDRNWLLYDHGAESFLLATSDVVWVYHSVTTYRRNGIPTGKTHTVNVCGKSEKKRARCHSIPVGGEEAARALMARLHGVIPDAAYGYDAEWSRRYGKDPEAFHREIVAAHRAAAEAEAAKAAAAAMEAELAADAAANGPEGNA